MFPARSLASMVALIALVSAPALGDDRRYRVTGSDSFQIGARDVGGEVLYDGSQTLSIERTGQTRRYVAKLSYVRTDGGATSKGSGLFVSTILPDGSERDEDNRDPNYLTILNQPFAVQLDLQTIRDVIRLDRAAPFSFLSPMTGAQLRGTLRHAGDGIVAGQRAVGILFEAKGRMKGTLPGHPELALDGTIEMSGNAYYTEKTALLMALDATMTITGKLGEQSVSDPITIVYRRSIRAEGPSAVRAAGP